MSSRRLRKLRGGKIDIDWDLGEIDGRFLDIIAVPFLFYSLFYSFQMGSTT